MTYKEFIKRHRIPREDIDAILDLLWHTSEEWKKSASSIPFGFRHTLLSTVVLGGKSKDDDNGVEIPGKPVWDSPIDQKRARKWLVANGYEKHQPKKRQAITQARAAKLIGASVRELRRWENEGDAPEGYPDYPYRDNARLLNTFASKYRKDKGLPPLQPSEYLSRP